MTIADCINPSELTRRKTPEPAPTPPRNRHGFAKRSEGFVERTIRESEWRRTQKSPSLWRVKEAVGICDLDHRERNVMSCLLACLNEIAMHDITRPAERFLAWPGNDIIENKHRIKLRTFQRAIQKLEEQGMLTRHYSKKNTRIGFDLTGFISMVEEYYAASDARVAEMRKRKEEEATAELPLDGIPLEHQVSRRNTSAQGTRAQTTSNDPADSPYAGEPAQFTKYIRINANITLSLDEAPALSTLSIIAGDADPEEKDPNKIACGALTRINRMMTCKNGRPAKPWAAALEVMDPVKATTLYYLCVLDPNRQKAPAAYFAWLISQIKKDMGLFTISTMIRRTIQHIKLPRPPRPDPATELACRPLHDPETIWLPDPNGPKPEGYETLSPYAMTCQEAFRNESNLLASITMTMPGSLVSQMFNNSRLMIGQDCILIQTQRSYMAAYIERFYKDRILKIANEYLGRPVDLIARSYKDSPPNFARAPDADNPIPHDKRYDSKTAAGVEYQAHNSKPADRTPGWMVNKPSPRQPLKDNRNAARRAEGAAPGHLVVDGLLLDLPVPRSRYRDPNTPEVTPVPTTAPVTTAPAPDERQTAILNALPNEDMRQQLASAQFEISGKEVMVRFQNRDDAHSFPYASELDKAARKVLGDKAVILIGWS